MPGTPSSSRIARAGLLIVSLALVAIVAEASLRLRADSPWWERLRTEQDHGELTRHAIDGMNLPLREAPVAAQKPAGTHRTLFLGDSFTYGLGVEAADTFVGLVEARLNEARPVPGAARYEAFNGGIPGSLTFQWRALLAQLGPSFAPDLVVAVFFVRDGVAGIHTSEPIDAIRTAMRELAESSWAYRHLHLYRFVRARSEQRRLSERYLARLRAGYFGPPEAARAEWWKAQTELLWMRSESHRLGARFALVIFPMLFELKGDHPLADVCAEIERFAVDEEIPVLSLLPAFRGFRGPELWVSAYDQHPNPRAHAIAADALYPFLESLTASPSAP